MYKLENGLFWNKSFGEQTEVCSECIEKLFSVRVSLWEEYTEESVKSNYIHAPNLNLS